MLNNQPIQPPLGSTADGGIAPSPSVGGQAPTSQRVGVVPHLDSAGLDALLHDITNAPMPPVGLWPGVKRLVDRNREGGAA